MSNNFKNGLGLFHVKTVHSLLTIVFVICILILEEAITWLKDWEEYSLTLPKEQQGYCLSRQTFQSLRITLHSVLGLTKFLLSECAFNYVLTARFNQDPLERFFGIIRQSSGGAIHPTTMQFLYLYRLMSVYSLVKTPKRGAVQSNQTDLLLKMKDIAFKKKHEKQNHLQELQDNLEKLFDEPDVAELCCEVSTLKEHDYSQADVSSCIVYFLGGYVARKLLDGACKDCSNTLFSDHSPCVSVALLTDLKSKGGLLHPTAGLFTLLQFVETHIDKVLQTPVEDIYSEIMASIFSTSQLQLFHVGCDNTDHKITISGQIIHFDITCRLHFFTRNINRNRPAKNKSRSLAKLSKL